MLEDPKIKSYDRNINTATIEDNYVKIFQVK